MGRLCSHKGANKPRILGADALPVQLQGLVLVNLGSEVRLGQASAQGRVGGISVHSATLRATRGALIVSRAQGP